MLFWLGRVFRGIRMAFQAVTNRWVPEIKRLNDNLVKLEESLSGTDECVMDIFALEEKLEDRMIILEEELNAVKAENIEMRNHFNVENIEMRNDFNSMIKKLNAITALVNEKHGRYVGDDPDKEGPREYPDAKGNPIKIVNYE